MKYFRIALSVLALSTAVVAGAQAPASAGEGTDYLSANRGKGDDRFSTTRGIVLFR